MPTFSRVSQCVRVLVLVGFLFLPAGLGLAPSVIETTLLKVTDGDTVLVLDEQGYTRKVRMLGMDTPESFFRGKGQEPWAGEATKHLHGLLNATPAVLERGGRVKEPTQDRSSGDPIRVQIELWGQDLYRRDLGYVIYKGKNMNLEMARDGWAHPYLYCTRGTCDRDWFQNARVRDFVDACELARKKGLGLFDPQNPIAETAGEFRRRVSGSPHYQFIGHHRTKQLFKPAEAAQVDPCQQIRFEAEADALALGYKY